MNNYNIEELTENVELYKHYLNKLIQTYEQKKENLNSEITRIKNVIANNEDMLFKFQEQFFSEKISKLEYALATNEIERTIENANEEMQTLNKKLAKVKKEYITQKRKIEKKLFATQNLLNKLKNNKEQEKE